MVPWVVETGKHTGRSPNAKAIVCDSVSVDWVDWNNNKEISEGYFDYMCDQFMGLVSNSWCYAQDVSAGSAEGKINLRIFTKLAWHSLFCQKYV